MREDEVEEEEGEKEFELGEEVENRLWIVAR
jgi:hypothetical protein